MNATVTVGKRLIPVEHIVLVEPFDASQAKIQTDKTFQSRIVLLNRDSVLTEEVVQSFVDGYGFRSIVEDGVATNPAIHVNVETFEPVEGFKPAKPYRSRLTWRDQDGNLQSKLLLTAPETLLAVAVRGEALPQSPQPKASRRQRRRAAPDLL